MTTVQDLQRRLIALGFPLPKYGPDGGMGVETLAAMNGAIDALVASRAGAEASETPLAPFVPAAKPRPAGIVPPDWMPAAKMERIICHWTAGAHKATEFDRQHYHILIEADGKLVRGIPSIKLNEHPLAKGYAAHTLSCNSGSIGVSLCCMAGANEAPFVAGNAPMTKEQWDTLTTVVAELCHRYGIPITGRTVLSHAEVQPTLGIQQRGKWDYTRLTFDPSKVGAIPCGNKLRREALAKL